MMGFVLYSLSCYNFTNMNSNYEIYFFDIDGTLAQSKQKISRKMSKLLSDLSQDNRVAILSGASIEQITNQVIKRCKNINLQNVYLLPTSGSALFVNKKGKWRKIYSHSIKKKYIAKFEKEIKKAFKEAGVKIPSKNYGPRLEYRDSQITYSVFGQNAPVKIKSGWDEDGSKRRKVAEILRQNCPEFDIAVGGTNSLDINLKNIDKAYGINKLCDYLKTSAEKCIFVGDAIFVDGNDYSVIKSNINTILTSGPDQTKKVISDFLINIYGEVKLTFFESLIYKIASFFRSIIDFIKKIFHFNKYKKYNNHEGNRFGDENQNERLYITRSHKNPLLSPTSYSWEDEGAFNPAAIYLGGRIHLLYRAIGKNGVSCIGYASSEDGIHFDDRLTYPIYYPTADFELNKSGLNENFNPDKYSSGGSWTGCEDPKICQLGDRLFLTYVAFCGWDSIRVAMSSISVKDFLNKKWNWTVPVLCSPKGLISKSGGLFPEKVKGKYVFFQRIFPDIMIDYIDNLRFDGTLPNGAYRIGPSKVGWDSRKISFGSTPIKTKHGWLVITHGVDDKDDDKYHIGAMLLDLDHPEKVLHRSKNPILSPELWYENDWKPGILYPCGAVSKDGTLLVYYGGGDKYVCVASAPFDDFLEALINEKDYKLKLEK